MKNQRGFVLFMSRFSKRTMRTHTRTIAGFLVLLFIGSLILPFLPNVENTILYSDIIYDDDDIDIDGWNDLNQEQKKAMVDWNRKGDSQDISLIGLSTPLPIDCEDHENICGTSITDLELDSEGNLYVVGNYREHLKWGEEIISGYEKNGFVSKLDINGEWEWIFDFGNDGDEKFIWARTISLDTNNNIYIGGSYAGDTIIGNTTFFHDNGLTYANGDLAQNGFITKLNSDGSWIWSKNISNEDSLSEVSDLVVDSNGDILVVIIGCGQITLDDLSFIMSADDLFTGCTNDAAIVKLSNSGDWLWVSQTSSERTYPIINVHSDNDDNIYVFGSYYEDIYFGQSMMLNKSVHSDAFFVAKLNSNGEWIWVNHADSDKENGICGIEDDGMLSRPKSAIDSLGNIVVTGTYDCYNLVFDGIALENSNDKAVFVAKINSDGEWQWAKRADGVGREKGTSVDIDINGDIYVSGHFEGDITIGEKNLISSDGFDVFLAKFDSNGKIIWATKGGGSGNDYSQNLIVSNSMKIYVIGQYRGTTTFGGNSLTNGGLHSTNFGDSFIFSLDGNVGVNNEYTYNLPITKIGSSVAVLTKSIAVDVDGNALVIGTFQGPTTFGNILLSTSTNGLDVSTFVAKLSKNGEWMWAIQVGDTSEGEDIKVDTSGDIYITGRFKGNFASFGDLYLSSTPKNNQYNNYDIFVAKLNAIGQFQWVMSAGGEGWESGIGLVLAGPSIFLVGELGVGHTEFYDVYPSSAGNLTIYNLHGNDLFVAKIAVLQTSTGPIQYWEDVKTIGGYNPAGARSITSDTSGVSITDGNILVAGVCSYECTYFDSNGTEQMIAGSSYGLSSFVVSYTYDLELAWLSEIETLGHSEISGIAVNSWGQIVVAGDFWGRITLNVEIGGYYWCEFCQWSESIWSNSDESETYYNTVFLVALEFNGAWDPWFGIQLFSSPNEGPVSTTEVKDLVIDSNDNMYITGTYNDTLNYDESLQPGAIGNFVSRPSGGEIFISKLDDKGKELWTVQAGKNQEYDTGEAIAVDSTGVVYSTGWFHTNINFNGVNLTSSGYQNSYISIGIESDFDGDGVPDSQDLFEYQKTQWSDLDGDGFGDNEQGHHGDACPTLFGSSWQDRWGCPDMDGDGQSDLFDSYMQDSSQWNDTDGDGLGDNWDGTTVDRNGSTNDIGEYWPDAYLPDPHPLDYDNDGFQDANLQHKGAVEPFDDCPLIYGKSEGELNGCIDSDGDGFADSLDDFSGDATQWVDSDGDGFGDSSEGTFPDDCPLNSGNSTKDKLGCLDYDGDGWSNISDWDDFNPNVWSDSDGDGFTDQLGHRLSDDCPGQVGYSHTMMSGCPDMDEDGIPDIYDDDTDGDGISNSIERQAGYDPYNNQSTPDDYDNDRIPDILDEDDDNDGYPDELENERGSDPKDADSNPLSMYGNQESGIYYIPGQGFSSSYQEEGYELSVSWLWALVSSEFLVPIILLPLSVLLLMGKRRKFKKFKKKMNKIEDIEELEELEEDIDAMIEKGSVKVEHAMLLRNQFERRREKLSGKSHMDRLFKNSREGVDYNIGERLGGPPNRGPPNKGPQSRGPPRRGPPL